MSSQRYTLKFKKKGMLLYPVVEKPVRLAYELNGHKTDMCTVNLAADWQDIRAELLGSIPASEV